MLNKGICTIIYKTLIAPQRNYNVDDLKIFIIHDKINHLQNNINS
jgi:hypothetical protein